MRFSSLPTLAFALTLPWLGAQAEPRRVPLWNGRDLTGWTVFMEDGALPASIASTRNGCLHLSASARGYLRTVESYSNYHLHVEWRWPTGDSPDSASPAAPRRNSGVILHLNGRDQIWPAGYEFQLLSGLAGEIVAFIQDLPGGRPHPRDGLKRARNTAPSSEKPTGEWNAADVYCRGATLEIIVNGVRQNRVDRLPVTAGAIALQLEGSAIEFREVWLELR